ncbi:hypothetical protein BFJ71_g299 [Fusarium oxysporum]|nr:hypothetical protein BFJ71_g299 [Fusarium oxysporum]
MSPDKHIDAECCPHSFNRQLIPRGGGHSYRSRKALEVKRLRVLSQWEEGAEVQGEVGAVDNNKVRRSMQAELVS